MDLCFVNYISIVTYSILYPDGIFYVNLSFDEGYDAIPPAIHFNTIPFHPNGK